MTILTMEQDFALQPWDQTITGSGSITINSALQTTTCKNVNTGTDRSYQRYTTLLFGGDRVKFSVLAKLINAGTEVNNLISIQSPVGPTKNSVEVWQDDWRLYEIEYTVPIEKAYENVCLQIGNGTTTNAEVTFARPKMELLTATVGAARTLAQGVFVTGNNAASITTRPEYQQFGIESMSWDSVGKKIDCILSSPVDFNDQNIGRYRPAAFISDSYSATKGLSWKIGEFDDIGAFAIRAIDVTTGLIYDLGVDGNSYEFHVNIIIG